ncbi:uncharacterized protein EAE98_003764 [Botrytis deweyae]|uniref:Cell wall protein n=1 Tax=Botrytis deweyae TaxID=2478750 RepID=A0ABQ7IRM6_9HELO|nr:uncharacterized protein EAE98_003764 [Botrytis deweyae]KAF7932465.1 hypothetical protein EAE98_003764 [Botrytis deweyae]
MQYSTIFVSFLFSTAVAAQGYNGTLTETQTCKEMLKLNALVQLASNQTKVDAITGNNATRAASLQAQASAASVKLTELQSNTTLMADCAVIDSAIMTNSSCTQQFLLQKFVDFAANETLVTATVNNDMTKVAEIELKASDAAEKLQTLQSNATLQAACPAVFMADECKMVVALQKIADLAMDDSKLSKIAKGNSTKEANIKAAASVASMQVMMLEANATLMAECQSMGIAVSNAATEKSTSSTTAKSTASINKMSLTALFMGVLALGMATL